MGACIKKLTVINKNIFELDNVEKEGYLHRACHLKISGDEWKESLPILFEMVVIFTIIVENNWQLIEHRESGVDPGVVQVGSVEPPKQKEKKHSNTCGFGGKNILSESHFWGILSMSL